MSDIRIRTFPIPGLDYVFVPPGLPLVAKSDSGATTSILVRGGAGTGKTTLAVALAHAISKACEGVTLYLSTEFLATEIPYKAAALNLPENSVAAWDTGGNCLPGTILVRHLLQTQAGENEQNLLTIGARKRAAIAAVWEILTTSGEPSASRSEGPPVRAVVLDAFGLPESDSEDLGLRNELLTLIQSLEYIGITPILVEEANGPTQTWLSFVVDIVFETELSSTDDTGHLLLRRLKCPKSRYGQALPGPHDYGLDVSTGPAVWPDLAFSNTWAPLRTDTNRAPTFFVPQGDRFALYPAGSIVISDWSSDRPFTQAFASVPGMRIAKLSCGPLMTVTIGRRVSHLGEGQGIFAVAWRLIHAYHAGEINSVSIVNFEYFLSEASTRVRSLRALSMLSAAGLSVCLHGKVRALLPVESVAHCVQGGKHARTDLRVDSPPRFCRADRWLPRFTDYSINDELDSALALHLDGKFAIAYSVASELGAERLAQFYMLVGNDVAAAEVINPAPRYPKSVRMWASLAAIHAGNVLALEELSSNPMALDVDEFISLLRALAAHQQFERLTELIDEGRKRWHLPAWYANRLRAEAIGDTRLLEQLASSNEVPAVHRAEIWYNIAGLRARENLDDAQTAWTLAHELNPNLDLEHAP